MWLCYILQLHELYPIKKFYHLHTDRMNTLSSSLSRKRIKCRNARALLLDNLNKIYMVKLHEKTTYLIKVVDYLFSHKLFWNKTKNKIHIT